MKEKGLSPRTRKVLDVGSQQINNLLGDGRVQGELNLPHYVKAKNPAVEFTKNAKAGAYDGLSDEDYQELLSIVERASRNFGDVPVASFDVASEWTACCDALRDALGHIHNIQRAHACETFDLSKETQNVKAGNHNHTESDEWLSDEDVEDMLSDLESEEDPSGAEPDAPSLVWELQQILQISLREEKHD